MKLTIIAVDINDFGMYKCVAKNSLGETDGSIKLYRKYCHCHSHCLFPLVERARGPWEHHPNRYIACDVITLKCITCVCFNAFHFRYTASNRSIDTSANNNNNNDTNDNSYSATSGRLQKRFVIHPISMLFKSFNRLIFKYSTAFERMPNYKSNNDWSSIGSKNMNIKATSTSGSWIDDRGNSIYQYVCIMQPLCSL